MRYIIIPPQPQKYLNKTHFFDPLTNYSPSRISCFQNTVWYLTKFSYTVKEISLGKTPPCAIRKPLNPPWRKIIPWNLCFETIQSMNVNMYAWEPFLKNAKQSCGIFQWPQNFTFFSFSRNFSMEKPCAIAFFRSFQIFPLFFLPSAAMFRTSASNNVRVRVKRASQEHARAPSARLDAVTQRARAPSAVPANTQQPPWKKKTEWENCYFIKQWFYHDTWWWLQRC